MIAVTAEPVAVVLAEVVVVATVVGRILVWTGTLIDTFMEVLTVDMRVEVLMDALTKIILGALANTSVDVLDVNVFAGVITAFEFASKNFCC